ncbi:MAG: cytochrome c peroxidase [Flavipsychrobacter sp.]
MFKALNKRVASIAFFLLVMVYLSCNKDKDPDPDPGNGLLGLVEMTPFKIPVNLGYDIPKIPDDNVMYLERVLLGKELFFDTRLSNNNESCHTCHKPEYGFSVDGVSTFDKGLTSLPLVNLAWYENFMWSGRIVGTLEDVMMSELNNRFNTDINKIRAVEDYRKKFSMYYGISEITKQDVAKALAQYMRALVSSDTKYDRYLRGFEALTAEEEAGRNLFFTERADCFHCHVASVLTDNMLHNNGLDSVYTKEIDKGYYNVTGDPKDLGKFRTPNLRNVALRTDYMHDGRFKTLEEVVNFYDHQVHLVSNVDPIMTKPGKESGLKLAEIEKQQLIAFLKTFTDYTMINDTLFKAP